MSMTRTLRNEREHRAWRAQCDERRDASETRRMIEAMTFAEARDLTTDAGHFVQRLAEKWGAYAPDGTLLTIKRSKPEAVRCCIEHASTGSITV